jgi:eukaryotic-like serine/threonine-protein kinase
MRKINYQLSPQYELIEDTDFLAARGYNSTALLDKMQNELLLLNPTIAAFLKAFQQPTSLRDVAILFQKGTEDALKDVETALKPFFTSMHDRQILEPSVTAIPKPEMPNGEGARLGGYTLQKRLACTPPIDIYKATDDNGQQFLLKRLLFAPDFPESHRKKDRQRFAHEFKILKILRGCPNICPLIFFDKQQDYAVIEFFEGDTLRHLIKLNTVFSLEEKIGIVKQILEAAAFMHRHGVLHGDWHDENILVNENNVVKVIDFDLAVKIGQRQQKNTPRGGIKAFMPPERIDDSAFEVATTPPDCLAEVFQIGVLVYCLFFADYPFKGETWKKLAQAIRQSEPDWTKAALPDAILLCLKKALAKNPEDRFESAVTMQIAWQDLFSC